MISSGARPHSLVVLNPTARGGRASELWAAVKRCVAQHSRPTVVRTDPNGQWRHAVHDAAARGVRVFVAAGGDGTVNALVNALLDEVPSVALGADERFTLGAVGLGSSNDFHKPYRHVRRSVPLRVDPSDVGNRDVGIARYRVRGGETRTRCFVVSASVGMTAEANALFTTADPVLRRVKPHSTTVAILYAALKTLVTYRNLPATVWIQNGGETTHRGKITSLNVMKTPFLSGWLRFDTPVEPNDRHLAVNLCDDLSRGQALAAFAALSRGRFLESHRPGTHHWRARRLTVEAPQPFALELDGEVVGATRVVFDVLPEPLRCCL